MSYISFITLFMILVIQIPFITVFILLLLYTLFICTSIFPLFLHTHWVALWRPLICTSRLVDQVLLSSYTLRGPGVSLYLIPVFLSLTFLLFHDSLCIRSSPLFILFPDSPYIITGCHFISVFIYYHLWISICVFAVIMIYHSRFLQLVRVT